jgi:peptidoglycan/LPS O-acetylase OafA/YrhL
MTVVPPTAPAVARPQQRLVMLDSLRFIAATAVLAQHALEQQGTIGRAIVGLLSPGVFGVVLFFLISGFVIPLSAGRRFNLRSFAIRRLLRIFPLTLVTFAIVALLAQLTAAPAFDAARAATARDWVANLLLVQDYVGAPSIHGVTWTLSLELIWYAIFALTLSWRGKRFAEPLLILFPVMLLAAAAASIFIHHRIPLARPGMIYAAVIGCRVYAFRQGDVNARRLAIEAAIFAIVMTACNAVSFGYFAHHSITVWQAIVPWLAAIAFFLGVAAVPAVGNSRIFDNRLLPALGAMSFSIYLLHPIALVAAEAISASPWCLPIALALTVALATAGYQLIELPGVILSKRLTGTHRRGQGVSVRTCQP